LFEEWQTTLEADSVYSEFSQSVLFPSPKNQATIKIYSRSWEGNFEELFKYEIDPNKYSINKELTQHSFTKILDNGDPATKVDLVFLAEGYTLEEMDKFETDALRFIDYLFSYAPYSNNKEKFNIWLVKSESEESGTDIPGHDIYKNTVLNSNFYTFGSERYLTTEDFFEVESIIIIAFPLSIMLCQTKYLFMNSGIHLLAWVMNIIIHRQHITIFSILKLNHGSQT